MTESSDLRHPAVRDWADRGRSLDTSGGRVFVVDVPAAAHGAGLDPVLVLHGFPSCSFDWRHVLPDLTGAGRRVVLVDFVGFGLSDKPDRRYSLELHADTIEEVAAALGLGRVALVTHDMGDSIGGELLARSLDGVLSFEVSQRVLSNGSIYLDLAQLTDGQQLLLGLDDVRLPPGTLDGDGGATWARGLAGVFAPDHPATPAELEAQAELAAWNDGLNLMPRLIRYIEDRRRAEHRYTGAIERHPSPLAVVWGEVDPVAVAAMVDRLVERRPDVDVVRLDGVGHYPMIESPEAFGGAVAAALARVP